MMLFFTSEFKGFFQQGSKVVSMFPGQFKPCNLLQSSLFLCKNVTYPAFLDFGLPLMMVGPSTG